MTIHKSRVFNFLGILLLGMSFFFETQLLLVNANLVMIFQIGSIICLTMACSSRGIVRYSCFFPKFLYLWFLLIPFFLYGFLHSEKMVVVRLLVGIVVSCLVSVQCGWINSLKRLLLIGGGIAVFFTLLFWIKPNLYSVIVDFYGYYPPGTGQLKYGYRAGITANYSQNGIHIAVFIMTMFSMLLADNHLKKIKQKKYFEIVMIFLAMLAFLLNGKRGTLLWCLISIVITWFVSSEKKSKFISRVTILFCISAILLEVALNSIPELNFVVERFSTLGTDGSATDRLAMWSLAFANFLESPIFGIGFLNYRAQYSNNLASLFIRDFSALSSYRRLDAHNVYIQLLCEIGIVGSIIYIVAVVLLLMNTVKILKYYSNRAMPEFKFVAILSMCFQIFYILYSLSGNCLYDMTFYLYMFAMAIVCSLNFRIKKVEAKNS